MKLLFKLAVVSTVLTCHVTTYSDQVVLVAKTKAENAAIQENHARGSHVSLQGVEFAAIPLVVEDRMNIGNRSQWIKKRLGSIILPSVSFKNDSLQDCLEYLRILTYKSLTKMEEPDCHIHFLRGGANLETVKVNLSLTNVSILEMTNQIASSIGSQVQIVDYGVLFELPPPTAAHDKKQGNPFE